MITFETKLNVADNSGAKKVQCIKVLGGSRFKVARVGDVIVVAVKEALPNGKIKKGTVQRAVVVRTKKEIKRQDGSTISFNDNAVVIINEQKEPVGSRVFGPVTRELRHKKFMKVVSLASHVL